MGSTTVGYVGGTPGADSNAYTLFATDLSQFPQRGLAMSGVELVSLSLLHSHGGTLKTYKAQVRDANGVPQWVQTSTEAVTVGTDATAREYYVAPLVDFKLEWVNGGSTQTLWHADVALVDTCAGRGADDEPFGMASMLDDPALLAFYDMDYGVTLGGTLLGSGPTPPPVAISGSATTTPGIYLQIDFGGGGALGVATFKASADNGSSFFQGGILTGANVALGGPLTGITAHFSAGTYDQDNVYRGTVAAVADQGPGALHLTQAVSANQMVFMSSAVNGHATVFGDGLTKFMKSGAIAVSQPLTIYCVYKALSYAANQDIVWSMAMNVILLEDSTPRTILQAGANLVYGGLVANLAYAQTTAVINGNAPSVLRENGIQRTSGNAGAASMTSITIGALPDGTHAFHGEWATWFAFRRQDTLSQQLQVEDYLRARYALP